MAISSSMSIPANCFKELTRFIIIETGQISSLANAFSFDMCGQPMNTDLLTCSDLWNIADLQHLNVRHSA